MKHKIIALSVLLIVISIRSIAQVHIEFLEESESRLFHEIVQQVKEYYENRDKNHGSGYKQFKRWEYDHSIRLDSTFRRVPTHSVGPPGPSGTPSDRNLAFRAAITCLAPTLWCTLAGCITTSSGPRVSVAMWRLRPMVSLPPS